MKHEQMRLMLDNLNHLRQTSSERRTAEMLWKKTDVRSAILVAADSPELVRSQDAWRVYDFAVNAKNVSEVKFVLRILNPAAFSAMCAYEGQEIEAAVTNAPNTTNRRSTSP